MTEQDWKDVGKAVGYVLTFAGIFSLLLMILAVSAAILGR